jgi:hypothetical protein
MGWPRRAVWAGGSPSDNGYDKRGHGEEPQAASVHFNRSAPPRAANGPQHQRPEALPLLRCLDLLEPTDEIRQLCTFVAHDLHQVRRDILVAKAIAPP